LTAFGHASANLPSVVRRLPPKSSAKARQKQSPKEISE
jgi:hypothetical protein